MRFFYYALLILMFLLGAAKAFVDYQLEHLAAQAVQQAQAYANISYQQIRLVLPAQVVVRAVQIHAPDFPPLHIQQLHLHKIYRFVQARARSQPFPEHWHISARNARLSLHGLKALPDNPVLWQMLGYQDYYLSPAELFSLLGQHISATMELQAQWQPADGRLAVRLAVRSEKLGDIELQLKAQGVQQNVHWQQIQIEELQMTWLPAQWLTRLSQYLGQKQQLSAAQLRQQLARQLIQDGQNSGVLDAQAQTAVSNFVQDLQALTLRLQPPKPFSAQQLFVLPPHQWQSRLGLSWQ